MAKVTLVDTKKVMLESRVALSKDVRGKLGVEPGDFVSFVEKNGRIYLEKTAPA